MAKKTVLWWGRFSAEYSRNRVAIALFKELGWEVVEYHVKYCCAFGDWEYLFRGPKGVKPDLVWVPVARQRDAMAACRWAHRRGIPVVFDPMISAWDKKVLEQQKWSAEEGRAKRLLAWETKLFNEVDMMLCDTSCHADFFNKHMGVPREKLRVLFTGTDETVFKPAEEGMDPPHDPKAPLRILYHGAYLPLHGTEYIVEAARRTQDLNIHWDFLGWGAYKAATEEKAQGIKNITFLEKVPYVDVPKVIRTADIVLGVFGTTEKASRVIGNKIYEAMACCRPVINEYCTGYPPEAKDCPAITFIPPGDAQALVDAVVPWIEKRAELEALRAEARTFFEKCLSMNVVRQQLADILKDLGF
jgi:glycosyltransferase involved in cell wall biosynthesis